MSDESTPQEKFHSISPAEFFYQNRQMAGFGNSTQAIYSTVKELLENSLDACEDARILPEVLVRIHEEESDILSLTVADNGKGVPHHNVPEAFATVLYGNKYSKRQRRGTFGLGVTMAILYGQITTDSPVMVHTKTKDSEGRKYSLLIDIKNNKPIIESEYAHSRSSIGTTVTIRLKGNLKRAQERVIEYLRLTSLCTPHALIEIKIDGSVDEKFGRWSDTIPPPTLSSRPHPRAVDMELLHRLVLSSGKKRIKDFLITSFQQVGERTAGRFLKFMGMNPKRTVDSLNREELSKLSTALRHFEGFSRPDAKCLSPVGRVSFLESVKRIYDPKFLSYTHRGPSEWRGNPFIMEGVLALGDAFPATDAPSLYRFANRVPLLYDASEDVITRMMRKIDWSRYCAKTSESIAVFIHLCSTTIPYKAAGKQSIVSTPEIENETLSILRQLGRNLKKFVTRNEHSARDSRKRRQFEKRLRQIAHFSAVLAEMDNAPPINYLVRQLFEVVPDA